jgi:hypothetical protein
MAADSRALAEQYLNAVADQYRVEGYLDHLDMEPSTEITDDGAEMRFSNGKSLDGVDTVSFAQTHFGLPIWEGGISVFVPSQPLRVTGSFSTIQYNIQINRPPDDAECLTKKMTPKVVAEILNLPVGTELPSDEVIESIEVTSDRLLICQYEASNRLAGTTGNISTIDHALAANPPTLWLDPVAPAIVESQHYVVREVLFTLNLRKQGSISWRAFIEVETCSVLYLRAFVSGIVGSVFPVDPTTAGGSMSIAPSSSIVTLKKWVKNAKLMGLKKSTPQQLRGEYIQLADLSLPHIPPPRPSALGDFVFDPKKQPNDFSAVSAYVHCDDAFRMVKGMGIPIKSYFDGTKFPVKVDHRSTIPSKGDSCVFGDCVNAMTRANQYNTGVESFRFALLSNYQPIGIAADKRAVLHEFGHALLLDATHSPNFAFAHSAGDSLAVIHCDPTSRFKSREDRFNSFPWISCGTRGDVRRHDRDLKKGWAWGSAIDDRGYRSEQILSTTLFRAYRAIGGDAIHPNPAVQFARRQLAARYLTYLIVSGIGVLPLMGTTPTKSPDDFVSALMNADVRKPDFEGRPGGTMQKVIPWAFHQQGLDRPDPKKMEEGKPDVDVYIDDGRDGDYRYQENYWSSRNIWNRLAQGVNSTHQTPVKGHTNYVYVRVKNRGYQQAMGVSVEVYHTAPGAGLMWNAGWNKMKPGPTVTAKTIAPGGSAIIGPFEWVPPTDGDRSLLAVVTAPGDRSNVDPAGDLPCSKDPTPDSMLIPFDNNMAQRNIVRIPGGGGKASLAKAFNAQILRINNPFNGRAPVVIESTVPELLTSRKWKMALSSADTSFTLNPGAQRAITMNIAAGNEIARHEFLAVGRPQTIEIKVWIKNHLVGGITYEIDPNMK